MSNRESYSDEEWHYVSSLPAMVGAAVSSADKSGIVGTVREATAGFAAASKGLKGYPDNELIQAIVGGGQTRSMTDAMEMAKENQRRLLERAQEHGVRSPEQFGDLFLSDCARVNEILQTKSTPEEAGEYKEWLLSVATSVAEAAKEGGFIGLGKGSVSEIEEALIAKMREALA